MWRLAAKQLNRWKGTDKEDLTISVNMSARDFFSMDVYKVLTGLVAEYGIESRKLRLEITETALIRETEKVNAILTKLREEGFYIEIDDFGTGYSSLSILKDVHADMLKIDMGFLKGTENKDRCKTIISSVISMAEGLGMDVLTEGVETEQREHVPLVSVLMASYNHEQYVEAAVRSVMEQKGVDFELVVIDDGSTDHSPDILEKLQGELGFRYVHRENKGFVPTMNELLSLARGKYYCSFASDDIMPPDRLKKQSDFLSRHPRSVACFGQIKTLSPEGEVSAEVVPLYMKNVPEVSFEQVIVSDRAR
jgi:hypothetical protein